MRAIKKLPDAVINRIAAGEVITSPYNIIKELLDNAIDAQATKITVKMEKGLKKIEVKDNGTGIERGDLELLCEKHCTSKQLCNNRSDTMGFRGEALYSISLCSEITVKTRAIDDQIGSMAEYKEGVVQRVRPVAYEGCGTEMEIANIFHNNMIRREQYMNNRNEMRRCMQLIDNYRMGYSKIEIECSIDDRKANHTLCRDRMVLIESITGLRNLLSASKSNFTVICSDLSAYMKQPWTVFYVNGRLVRNENVRKKVLQKYKGHPFVFVEVWVDEADVNVHPSKEEVLVDVGVYEEVLEEIDRLLRDGNIVIKGADAPNTGTGTGTGSTMKIYASPATRSLNESFSASQGSISIKVDEVDSGFIKSLVFVGCFGDFMFAQHQTNLIKISKRLFLQQAFTQIVRCTLETFGDAQVKEEGVFRIYEIDVKCSVDGIDSTDEVVRLIVDRLVETQVDQKLFNRIKGDVKGTREMIETASIVIDLKELYKTFDRC